MSSGCEYTHSLYEHICNSKIIMQTVLSKRQLPGLPLTCHVCRSCVHVQLLASLISLSNSLTDQ